MNPFRFYEAVQTSQAEFDTTRLSLGGVNVWMIIRLIMLGRLSGEATRRLSGMYGLASHSGVLFNQAAPLENRNISPSQYDVDAFGRSAMLFQPKGADDRGAEAAFFELPADYTLVEDGLAVNRIADSFVDEFGSRIRKVCRFAPRMLAVAKRVEPTLVLTAPGPWDQPADARRTFRDAVREYCAYAHARFPAFAPQQTEVLKTTREVLTYAAGHEAWLAGAGFRQVYLQAFISFEKYAVLVACKRLGITTVDIQHGYWDRFSIYNHLPQVADGDIALYPDVMWTWGEASTRALRADPSAEINGARIVLGGDVWGARMQARAPELTAALKEDTGGEAYSRRILVTYQVEALLNADAVVKLLPETLYAAIKAGPPDWLWMLRVHPRSLHLIGPLRDMLAEEEMTNVDVEASSLALVEAAIDAADVFMTGFSVSALEANARGKTVLITDDVGKELFAELIAEGVFERVDAADDILQAVEAQRPPTRDVGYYARDLSMAHDAFDRIAALRFAPRRLPEPLAGPASMSSDDLAPPIVGDESVPDASTTAADHFHDEAFPAETRDA